MGRNSGVKLGLTAFLIWLTIAIASVVGYIMNVVAIIGTDNILNTGIGVVRVVGLFVPPLGVIMGLFF